MADDRSAASVSQAPAAAGSPPIAAGPEGGGLILASLIIVAAVANLNLSVANVALPASARLSTPRRRAQPGRRRLLARARRIGALAGRPRRPLRPQDAAPPRRRALHPGVSAGRASHRSIEVPDRRAHSRWCLRRHGVSDHSRADHGAVGGAGRTHRSPSGRPSAARSPRLGLSSPASCSSTSRGARSSSSRCRSRSWPSSWRGGSCRPTSTRRPTRSTTSAASCPPSWSVR